VTTTCFLFMPRPSRQFARRCVGLPRTAKNSGDSGDRKRSAEVARKIPQNGNKETGLGTAHFLLSDAAGGLSRAESTQTPAQAAKSPSPMAKNMTGTIHAPGGGFGRRPPHLGQTCAVVATGE
jgi:hypothetical protein